MPVWHDHDGHPIRVATERLAHILEHPELVGQEARIAETLASPEAVVRSRLDDNVRLYYRSYEDTPVGAKLLCGVVKWRSDDAFLITAYFTDRQKGGVVLWAKQ